MKKKIKRGAGDVAFDIVNIMILALLALSCVIPFINTLATSLSGNESVLAGQVFLLPKQFQINSYRAVFADWSMVRSMLFTVGLTVAYVALAMLMSILAAYPLSKKRLKGRGVIWGYLMLSSYMPAGIIPSYLLINALGLLNTFWALLLPALINTYNIIVMKSFFANIPESLEESARIDGANELVVLWRIILPLSMPILATISLFFAVSKWNSYTDALFYITDTKLFPLQLKLRQLISLNQTSDLQNQLSQEETVVPETLKAASLMFATIPILCVYPWLQKYFVKGVMIGSVKG